MKKLSQNERIALNTSLLSLAPKRVAKSVQTENGAANRRAAQSRAVDRRRARNRLARRSRRANRRSL